MNITDVFCEIIEEKEYNSPEEYVKDKLVSILQRFVGSVKIPAVIEEYRYSIKELENSFNYKYIHDKLKVKFFIYDDFCAEYAIYPTWLGEVIVREFILSRDGM
jgi:hypothetical protein